MNKFVVAVVLVVAFVFSLSTSPVLAQELDYCEGDFDCDGDCDGTDAAEFKTDFGRSNFQNPCPACTIDIPKTGQLFSYATGDDGDLEIGFEPKPLPRFTDNGDWTVTDNLTRLIWMKHADCFGMKTWENAILDCNGLADGSCLLTDSSTAGDWRLPNRFELESLLDMASYSPATSLSVQCDYYWSSTSFSFAPSFAWRVDMCYGMVDSFNFKSELNYVRCVRGGL